MSSDKTQSRWRGMLAAVPAVGLSLLPNVTCPACWPAYAGLLSSLGVPMMMDNTVLMPLTVLCMVVAVGSLAYRAKNRRGYGPFGIGVVAAVTVIVGKFVFAIDGLAYGGVVLLVAASFWNSRPRRRPTKASCSTCAEPTDLVRIRASDQQLDERS